METVEKILERIHRIYEGNTTYPSSDSEDYAIRFGLINDAIKAWETVDNVKWQELYKNYSTTTTANVSTYPCPSDFLNISSLVRIKSSYYVYKKNEEVMTILRQDPSKKFFYITGGQGNYTININPIPTISGDTLSYSYYKKANEMTSGSSVPEMSRPMFIVYWVLARLYEVDGRNDLVVFYEQKANDVLNEMITANEAPPFMNEFKITDDDISYKLDAVSFGI